MTATSLAAGDNPDMKPHPRVTAVERRYLRNGVRILRFAANAAEQPITSAEVALVAAGNLAYFARCARDQVMAPWPVRNEADISPHLTRAIAHLTHCAELSRSAETTMPAAVFEAFRSSVLGLAGDVDRWAYKHPYRLFLRWFESATRVAALLCEGAASESGDIPTASMASLELRLALANPPKVANLSDGYLAGEDVAALMYTDVYTLAGWITRFRADPFPAPDYEDDQHPALWHADRAAELRAWWLRHDELPVSDKPAVTPGHRIGDQYLTSVR